MMASNCWHIRIVGTTPGVTKDGKNALGSWHALIRITKTADRGLVEIIPGVKIPRYFVGTDPRDRSRSVVGRDRHRPGHQDPTLGATHRAGRRGRRRRGRGDRRPVASADGGRHPGRGRGRGDRRAKRFTAAQGWAVARRGLRAALPRRRRPGRRPADRPRLPSTAAAGQRHGGPYDRSRAGDRSATTRSCGSSSCTGPRGSPRRW